MGILNSVSKLAQTAQRIVVGSDSKKVPRNEPPTMRMIIAEEPRPSHRQQVHSWINGGEAPDRAARMHQKIHEMHHTDYMAFPEGEGVMGIHRVKGFQKSPHDIDGYYSEPMFRSNRRRR